MPIPFQIPHSYQQLLSAEKTPTICGTVPAFEGLIKTLREYQYKNISAIDIIKPGIKKLEDYHAETAFVPAYTLAICKFLISHKQHLLIITQVLDPSENLGWFREYRPDEVSMVKDMLYEAVSLIIFFK